MVQGTDAMDFEKPVHNVKLSGFYIGKFEVTQALWTAVMEDNPSEYQDDENFPVETVSWREATKFIEKLNLLTGKKFRLPSEAEWEFAARGGVKTQNFKFSGSNTAQESALCAEDWFSGSPAVCGSKKANELGIYDMSGNVAEWCQDWYGNYTAGFQTNPKGPNFGIGRVIRGGGWNDKETACRVTARVVEGPEYTKFNLGFRIALSQQ